MKFRFVVRGPDGKEEERTAEAPSRFTVYSAAGKEGGTVLAIEEVHPFSLGKLGSLSLSSGVKQSQIITMTKNLSGMLGAGLSLSRALSVVERQSSNKRLKKVAADLTETVTRGGSFHEALATHRELFPDLYIAMVRAGEESGGLAEALSTLALQMEHADALRRKIKGAMIYPAIVITAVLIVGVLMLTFVVPTLTKTFTDLHVKLPLATQIIAAAGDFMSRNALAVLAFLVLAGLGLFFFLRSKAGRRTLLFTALHAPAIAELARETYAARTARTLASLLSSGVPVLRGLEITESVVGENPFGRVVAEAREKVKRGEPVSSAFTEHSKLYPLMLGDMLSVGEETGKVAEMLRQVAEFYEADVEQRTKDLSTIIEPVLMLLIGAGVGVFAVSMIAPIYSLSSAL